MKTTYLQQRFFSRLTWGFFLFGLLFFTAPSYSQDIQVDSADPSSAEQGIYDLEVTVSGDNFGADSEVYFFVHYPDDPQPPWDPGGITVKNVKRRGPKTLKVTIDVAPDAQTKFDFDICVRSRGRTGKGTELFRVLKKTDWVWQVKIPEAGDFNILGGQPSYRDTDTRGMWGDGMWIDVTQEGGGRDGLVTHFEYAIYKCRPHETCFGLSPAPITLQHIRWEADRVFSDPTEGPPCIFPGTCGLDYKTCLECFVNREHPHWGDDQNEHPDDYRSFYFSVRVRGDFTSVEVGPDGPVRSSGTLVMQAWNTDDVLINGDEDHHGLYSHVNLPGDDRGYVEVERLGGDSWKLDVHVNNVYPRMRFVEVYRGCFKPVNKKGNCPGEYKQTIWAWTSGAEPSPLHFQVTWSKDFQ